MAARTQTARSVHSHFMRAVNEEFTKFERSEREFRQKDREERAKRLRLPVKKYDTADRGAAKPSSPTPTR